MLVDVRADATDVHVWPSVLQDTAYPEIFSDSSAAFHDIVSFLSSGVTTRSVGTDGIATGEVALSGVVTRVTVGVMAGVVVGEMIVVVGVMAGVVVGVMAGVVVGVMMLFVSEGDPLEELSVVLLELMATLLFVKSERATGDGMNGSAVDTAINSARTQRKTRRSSRLICVMTDDLLLAVVGVGADLPRFISFTNSPLVLWMFFVDVLGTVTNPARLSVHLHTAGEKCRHRKSDIYFSINQE